MAESEKKRQLTDIPQHELPEEIRAPKATFDYLHRTIEAGKPLNQDQVQFVVDCVRFSFANSLTFKKTYGAVALNELQKKQHPLQEDRALLSALEKVESIRTLARTLAEKKQEPKISRPTEEPEDRPPPSTDPNVFVSNMKEALAKKNFEAACGFADSAVSAYPRYPQILFIAGTCYMLQAANIRKGDELAIRLHYLRRATSAMRECITLSQESPALENLKLLASERLQQAYREQEKLERILSRE